MESLLQTTAVHDRKIFRLKQIEFFLRELEGILRDQRSDFSVLPCTLQLGSPVRAPEHTSPKNRVPIRLVLGHTCRLAPIQYYIADSLRFILVGSMNG